MKIILSNWINLSGIFGSVFLFTIILTITDANLSYNIFQATLAALIAILGYGMMFWAFLLGALFITDLILIVPNQKNLKLKLIIEWLIISSPFIYWTIEYEEWIFAVGIVSFLVTQLLREKYILRREELTDQGNVKL
ncbi:hypothetical protein AAFN85_15790 [Mucilaginibacter sp. CAU 1740]|uniref:hypothetical protein n=1 Tax=Mucilaginibacter sp. CAU 1740 TaxID=3140365 RepID=UPI00325BE897